MILAPRREGGLASIAPRRSMLHSVDRNLPLWLKLIIPVIGVTLAGTFLFGLLLSQNTRRDLESTYTANADASAQAASRAFYSTISDPVKVNSYLADVASAQPNFKGIWIVNVVLPGQPVVASDNSFDLGRVGLIDNTDVTNVLSGQKSEEILTQNGHDTLETIYPVKGNAFAIVIRTSLDAANQTTSNTVRLVAGLGLFTCLLEVMALVVVLEFGVLRRIRRIGSLVSSFRGGDASTRLSEGAEPEGRDALFNLARRVDRKLIELGERERAGSVISDLGIMALQGAEPDALTRRALEIVRTAGDLERCFLVDSSGAVRIVEATIVGETTAAKLPIWLGALVRSTAQARRPLLADGLGQDSRYWEAGSVADDAVAAFVPLAGNPTPIAVMVGVARSGSHLTAATISMMEAVAAALGESLQRRAAEKAQHESEVKSKALSTVSHEMRNPLNAMLGFSELLLAGAAGPLNTKQEAYVRRVDEASHHLLRLVNDYLDLAKIMSGSNPMQLEAVTVATEVLSVIELLRPMADDKGVLLHSEAAPTAVARADRMRLRQVLLNLLSNAIKFTPAKGHVRVEVAGGSNGVRISIIDTGIGIPASQQHLVFTEFAHLQQEGVKHGAGLGLALTKRFVEAMGGFIKFTSSEGAGTIFDVWLPGEQSPSAVKTDAGAAGKSPAGQPLQPVASST